MHRFADPGLEFNAWQLTTALSLSSADAPVVEFQFYDPFRQLTYPAPAYSASVNLTRRSYDARSSADTTTQPYTAYDMVPVTHVCNGGCGGAVINVSNSAYAYENGVCVAPDTCQCNLQPNASVPAFIGDHCQTPNCATACRNGDCVVSDNVPACVCHPGWTGDDCGTAECVLHGCPAEFGSCDLPDVCSCEPSRYGPDCSRACDCGQGTCSDGSSGNGACTCDAGYYGKRCALQCMCRNGVCNDGAGGDGSCKTCDAGWMGANCDLQLVAVAVPAAVGVVVTALLLVMAFRKYLRYARHKALLYNVREATPGT